MSRTIFGAKTTNERCEVHQCYKQIEFNAYTLLSTTYCPTCRRQAFESGTAVPMAREESTDGCRKG